MSLQVTLVDREPKGFLFVFSFPKVQFLCTVHERETPLFCVAWRKKPADMDPPKISVMGQFYSIFAGCTWCIRMSFTTGSGAERGSSKECSKGRRRERENNYGIASESSVA
jgi:hypothetical protein